MHNFNNSLSSSTFPTALEYADVKPVFKKEDKTEMENYRPIRPVLPLLSVKYIKDLDITKHMHAYYNKRFSKF